MKISKGESAAWLKNSPTVESFKRNLKTYLLELSSANLSSNVSLYCVSLYAIIMLIVRGLGRPTWHHPHRLMKLRFL